MVNTDTITATITIIAMRGYTGGVPCGVFTLLCVRERWVKAEPNSDLCIVADSQGDLGHMACHVWASGIPAGTEGSV